ncbi:MAG TPA: phage holin family protein [Chloroflexota bacterium]|nr:phage holin family protein [Chloroflexota bacterium]
MTNLLIRLGVSTGAVLLAQWAFARWGLISVDGWPTALIFAVVLGLLNALLRPILLFITCPFTVITLGLFVFVVNAVVFWLAARIVPGIEVNGFVGALVGSLTVTICLALVDRYLEQ